MTLSLTGLITESFYKGENYRGIARQRLELPTADGALYQLLTPLATATYTVDAFPAAELNGTPLNNDLALPVAFAGLYLLHIRVGKHRQDLPAAGTVAITLTDLFGTGTADCGVLEVGDELIRTKLKGFAVISTSALELVVTDPDNLALEIMILGPETTGGIYT